MFTELLTSLNQIASSVEVTDYPVYPHDYKGEISTSTFLKFSVVLSTAKRKSYDGVKKIPGLVVVSIFYPSGQGQLAPVSVADELRTYFEDQLVLPQLITGEASLQFMGRDKDDSTLSRADFSVPFNYYGE